eukprot:GFUD01123675.1.p1 GENE.GFUD01123675.1~~GFUD01123675.1.p1  ORF type:complete len:142 (-),score=22.84 GFUD01123675.1:104-529(-)
MGSEANSLKSTGHVGTLFKAEQLPARKIQPYNYTVYNQQRIQSQEVIVSDPTKQILFSNPENKKKNSKDVQSLHEPPKEKECQVKIFENEDADAEISGKTHFCWLKKILAGLFAWVKNVVFPFVAGFFLIIGLCLRICLSF